MLKFIVLFNVIALRFVSCEETAEMQDEYNLTEVQKFKCENPATDCSNSGICAKEKDECICFDGFQTHFPRAVEYLSQKPRCNHKSKKQLYALMLSMFLSFGFLYFYLGNLLVGYIQLFLFLFILVFNVVMIIRLSLKHLKKLNRAEYRDSLSLGVIICFFSLILLFWYLFDIIMVFFNIYKDQDNANLQPII